MSESLWKFIVGTERYFEYDAVEVVSKIRGKLTDAERQDVCRQFGAIVKHNVEGNGPGGACYRSPMVRLICPWIAVISVVLGREASETELDTAIRDFTKSVADLDLQLVPDFDKPEVIGSDWCGEWKAKATPEDSQ